MKKQSLFAVLIFVIALSVAWMGCSKSTDPSTSGTLSLASVYTKSAVTPKFGLSKALGGMAVDSVVISRARFVLRDIKFKTTADSLNFKSEPVILELNLSGAMQNVSVKDVPFGSYSRIEFDVHRVESTEVALLPLAERAAFADFLAGQRYSIIINGTVYKTGVAPQAFTYRSKVDAKQKIDLTPALVVSESSIAANSTMLISSANWFTNSTGILVDPIDPNSEGVIDENLKNTIKVFKDNNKDGSKDNS